MKGSFNTSTCYRESEGTSYLAQGLGMLEASEIQERDRLENRRDFCCVNPVPLMTNNNMSESPK